MDQGIYRGEWFGRERCGGGDFPRHRHAFGYMCVILAGRFVEAGDAGRFEAAPGDVLVHQPFEAHLDLFGRGAPDVLNLPLASGMAGEGLFHIEDPDAIVRAAERDPQQAAAMVAAACRPGAGVLDWPDLLAARLREAPALSLGGWARSHGLAPATVSRGFRRAYGTSPARYRAEARARRAWRALSGEPRPLADLAFDLGFADQAHMTRAVRSVTGLPPGRWRGEVKPVQDPALRSA